MGSVKSKSDNKFLYEPIQVYSPMTRYHMLHIAMSDGGLVEYTNEDYSESVNYIEKKGVEIN